MRIDALDSDSIMAAARSLPYLYVKGLSNNIYTSSLGQTTGDRLLAENNYRSIDLYTISEHLEMDNPDNKRMVLRLLHYGDLLDILRLLSKSQIIEGLQYLDKSRILRLMFFLPRKYLIRMLMLAFTPEQLVKMMPTPEMINILRSPRIDNTVLVKAFRQLDPRFIKILLSKILGAQQVAGLHFEEMLNVLQKLKKRQIVEGMKLMPFKLLIPLFTLLLKMDPELLNGLSDQFLMQSFQRLSKRELMNTFEAVPEELIISLFLSQLAPAYLQQAAMQIDTGTLANYLIHEQPDLLLSLAQTMAA